MNLRRWEAINELVAVTDYIGERKRDLQHSHPDIYKFLQEVQYQIGDFFNSIDGVKIMKFGIPDSGDKK